jgi:hypothetical protein
LPGNWFFLLLLLMHLLTPSVTLPAADISGTLPASFSRLNRLELLDLEFNFLGGTISQQQLCPERNVLQAVYLRANNFTGSLNLTACRRLEVADIQVRVTAIKSGNSGSSSRQQQQQQQRQRQRQL